MRIRFVLTAGVTVILSVLLAGCSGEQGSRPSESSRDGSGDSGNGSNRASATGPQWSDYLPIQNGRVCTYSSSYTDEEMSFTQETTQTLKYTGLREESDGTHFTVEVSTETNTAMEYEDGQTESIPMEPINQSLKYVLGNDGNLRFEPTLFGADDFGMGIEMDVEEFVVYPAIDTLRQGRSYSASATVTGRATDSEAQAEIEESLEPGESAMKMRMDYTVEGVPPKEIATPAGTFTDVVGVSLKYDGIEFLNANAEARRDMEEVMPFFMEMMGTTTVWYARDVGLVQTETEGGLAGAMMEDTTSAVPPVKLEGCTEDGQGGLVDDAPGSGAEDPEPAGPDGSSRPDADPCDSSEALEEVVRYTRPEQFPESGGDWRGVVAADNDDVNPGAGYCFEDYAFGFLQPRTAEGEFNWVVVARSDWRTEIFPTDLECVGGDAIDLTEEPVVEEMLCTTSQGDQGSSGSDGGGSDTSGDADPPYDGEAVSLDQAVGDYYRAVGLERWSYTYSRLGSQTKSMFTEEEWSRRNQWFWDRNPTVYHILSIESDGEYEGSVAEVDVGITGEDGSYWVRSTYFVKEGGEWMRRFSEEETDLFMPEATFEEFVEAHTGGSSEDIGGSADGVCDPLSGEDPDCVDDQQGGKSALLRFDGSWWLHSVDMKIVSDATGSQVVDLGPCSTDPFEPGASGAMCQQVLLVEFSEASPDSIVGTITDIRYETREGEPPPPDFESSSEIEVGYSFGLEFADDNLLRSTWLDQAAGLNGEHDVYWCNTQTSEENLPRCGA